MLWIYLLVLFLILFGGLIFVLWMILTKKVTSATNRLHELSKDYAVKEEEANRLLQNAQKEAKAIVVKETQSAEEAKAQILKDAQEQKDRILQEAHQKAEELSVKAQRNAEFIRKELDQKIDERAKELISQLIQNAIPSDFLQEVHEKWVNGSDKNGFDFKHLKIPENVNEANITSAFPLSDGQLGELKRKLKKQLGADVTVKVEVDATLLAGINIKLGSVVVDASLRNKVQKALQQK